MIAHRLPIFALLLSACSGPAFEEAGRLGGGAPERPSEPLVGGEAPRGAEAAPDVAPPILVAAPGRESSPEAGSPEPEPEAPKPEAPEGEPPEAGVPEAAAPEAAAPEGATSEAGVSWHFCPIGLEASGVTFWRACGGGPRCPDGRQACLNWGEWGSCISPSAPDFACAVDDSDGCDPAFDRCPDGRCGC